ncbi:fatty acid synthase subunit alpha [Diplogelasinospora grovesii]|uniref:beta-ketoacyl-[acyl-carrier-protein] synthase I n=1 Tax=Diplogelasinospora grovesii TaxID=303347 RepID=A0AAN6S0E2_9PEZI|nr:fatty acid synthase subunit alpha [Diplogelasinospora grovesii]
MTQTFDFTTTSSTPEKSDHEVARTLLIELLAHQFCYPVQWIDTQDFILGACSTHRLVEMGPANTLANMAKRTIALKYASKDTATGLSRELLTFQQNLDAISYNKQQRIEVENDAAASPSDNAERTSRTEEAVSRPSQNTDTDTMAVQSNSTVLPYQSAEIEDSPPTTCDIVAAIVAAALKRPLNNSNMMQSIKVLCAGRSTLQNEILGDLDAEFGSLLPDGAEDLSLEALCQVLQSRFTGKLGKKSNSLIDRMTSQKLPASFQASAVRKHLKQAWGLGAGRQSSILLQAVNGQLESRLKEDEAKAFFDGIVRKYMDQHGLKAPADVSGSSATGGAPAMISAEALEHMEGRQRTGWAEQAALYTKLLGLNVHESQDTISKLEQRIVELEQQLDGWIAEHGEVYSSGLRPISTPLKTRVFDSWWNWAMQDLLRLVALATENVSHSEDDDTLAQLCQRIANRSHERLLKVVRYLVETTQDVRVAAVLRGVLSQCEARADAPASVRRPNVSWAPETVVEINGKISYRQTRRPLAADSSVGELDLCHLQLGRKRPEGWQYREELSSTLRQVLVESKYSGLSLAEQNVLVTGAGPGSIGCELVAQLLSAGATVVLTSSSYSPTITRYFQDLYAARGGKGSKLVLVPFNQASVRDLEALVKYVYAEDGLNMDLDFVIPFAAISENGRSIADIDSKSELAHRLMLTNTIRLLGQIKHQKQDRGIITRPAQVIVPLSPNHGSLGNDGLYAESKLGLESLLDKFHSEDWAQYLLICGAIIGWTRGTKLTSNIDLVAQGMEELGMRTFSQEEMAFNILALLSPPVTQLCMDEPLVADFSGGMGHFPDIKGATTGIRTAIQQLSEERRAVAQDSAEHDDDSGTTTTDEPAQINPEFRFPPLPVWESDIQPLAGQLEGMVDLDRVVVVAGFAEVGPFGSARVRWDMEVNGRLSPESCIELAWAMGLIKAHSGVIDGQLFSGWLDHETGKPIADTAVQDKYESYMLEHAGVRFMEQARGSPSWSAGEALHEIEITKDHEPFEVSRETALQLKQAHGDNIHLTPVPQDDNRIKVVLTKGAKIMIPKLIATQHTVGGQIPMGWDARTYGIPEDVVSQVDPVTLYALVAAAEALQSAGVDDAFDFYNHIHVSDVANCVGSGLGGCRSFGNIFKGRYKDEPVSKDVLSEVFISSGSAWINMLLLSAAGANRTPVGACATALESLDTACDLIQTGKAKVCLVGAFDDMMKEVSDEFANLQATINADQDVAAGREPREMSRPSTSTRAGFVESEGAGIQLVTSASVALKMGLPIYSIIAMTHTAMDKAGRSIPAPGRGLLGAARQTLSPGGELDSPWMSMAYRRRALQNRLTQIREMRELQVGYLDQELAEMADSSDTPQSVVEEYRARRLEDIELDVERDRREARNQYGNRFWTHDERIAPIRGALAVWGLTVDDLDVTSFHGTSTKANEKNEATLVNAQLRHLGRKEGNVLPVVLQKALTGHPKGPAGAWMLNGCIQMMHDGRIPGNRNGDNIDSELEQCEYLVFPNKTLSKPNMKAFALQLFGFGQKGGMAIGVHPRYLYATMQRGKFEEYSEKVRQRERKAMRRFQHGIFTNSVFRAKHSPPYAVNQEMRVLVDPAYRTCPA